MTGRERLNGWKEIAEYLKVTVRTAQRREGEGLPIRRCGGTVFAYGHEIEDWLRGNPDMPVVDDAVSPPVRSSFVRRRALIAGAGVAGLILVVFVLWLGSTNPPSPGPLELELDGRSLRVVHPRQGLVWEHTFERVLIGPEIYNRNMESSAHVPQRVTDLNGDGTPEVLVLLGKNESGVGGWSLCCLDDKGDVTWTYDPGEMFLWDDEQVFPNWMMEFEVVDLDGDGIREVVVYSRHVNFFPAKFTILDDRGEVRGAYYHGGWFYDWRIHDFDGDGYAEILAAGTNNGLDKAVFAVLDSRRIDGHSVYPVPPVFPDKTIGPAREKAYLAVPPEPLHRYTGQRPALKRIDLFQDYLQLHLEVILDSCTAGKIYFFLDNGLHLRSVSASDDYIRLCRCARESGRVDYIYDPADIQAIGAQILYWDGLHWTATPTLNLYWTGAHR